MAVKLGSEDEDIPRQVMEPRWAMREGREAASHALSQPFTVPLMKDGVEVAGDIAPLGEYAPLTPVYNNPLAQFIPNVTWHANGDVVYGWDGKPADEATIKAIEDEEAKKEVAMTEERVEVRRRAHSVMFTHSALWITAVAVPVPKPQDVGVVPREELMRKGGRQGMNWGSCRCRGGRATRVLFSRRELRCVGHGSEKPLETAGSWERDVPRGHGLPPHPTNFHRQMPAAGQTLRMRAREVLTLIMRTPL